MRKLSAHYVFPLCSPPLKNGILVLDDDGTVLEVIDTKGQLREKDRLEFYSGVLIPILEDVSIQQLWQFQQENQKLGINDVFKHFDPKTLSGFWVGQKTGVWLVSSVELPSVKITGNSKLRKLV